MKRSTKSAKQHPGVNAWAIAVTKAQARRQPREDRDFRGRYVYAWFNDCSPLPFYVGKGTGDRAWSRHEDEHGRAAYCQTVRVANPGFRVEVIRDNLTDEGAALVEACMITLVCKAGGTLANQREGLSRRERPPLELPAVNNGPLEPSGWPPDVRLGADAAADMAENTAL